MLRTTPLQPSIALDRNKATRTKQGECEEEVGKKTNRSNTNTILPQPNELIKTLALMM
jgi:hypothetical protein